MVTAEAVDARGAVDAPPPGAEAAPGQRRRRDASRTRIGVPLIGGIVALSIAWGMAQVIEFFVAPHSDWMMGVTS